MRSSASRQFRWLVAVLALALSAGPVRADEVSDLRSEVKDLKSRLQSLEQRLSRQESAPAASVSSSSSEIPAWVQAIKLSGFVDASYQFNTDPPESRVTSLRVFDNEANGFQPNAFELVVEKPVSEDSRVGFRSDLDFGEDSEIVGSVTTGLGSTADELDLQQAYVEALLPVGNGLDMKFGKFVTLHGAEVIESKDNWNFSRSFLFGYAIPFTHTGVRFSYPWTDWLTTLFGVNQGWDIVDDNNSAKTLEFGATITPTEKTTLSVCEMVGAEQTGDSHDKRNLIDVVLGYNPCDKLSLKLNYDYGFEEDAVIEDTEDASWQGVAGYARYQVNDWYAVALRGEYFLDQDGIRTGARATNGVGEVGLWELTLTHEFKLYKDLITRLEYRHDQGDEAVFASGSGFDHSQDTVGLELIYPF